MLGMIWFGYISFLYFITQKLGTSAAVPVNIVKENQLTAPPKELKQSRQSFCNTVPRLFNCLPTSVTDLPMSYQDRVQHRDFQAEAR